MKLPEVSIHEVFGENLRKLCRRDGLTFAETARNLGIGKIQFQRLLRGQSFPRPFLLKRVCALFDVDAGILISPLPDSYFEANSSDLASVGSCGSYRAVSEVFSWCLEGAQRNVPASVLPDGLYRYWVSDGLKQTHYYCLPCQVMTKSVKIDGHQYQVRSMRAYHNRQLFSGPNLASLKRNREVRGLILAVADGITWITFNTGLSHRISLVHLIPNSFISDGSFSGFVAWGRAETVDHGRISRCYLEKVAPVFSNILSLARIKAELNSRDVPDHIFEYIRRPL
jgi:transcriptional regulator with XRE-family HTH domain